MDRQGHNFRKKCPFHFFHFLAEWEELVVAHEFSTPYLNEFGPGDLNDLWIVLQDRVIGHNVLHLHKFCEFLC